MFLHRKNQKVWYVGSSSQHESQYHGCKIGKATEFKRQETTLIQTVVLTEVLTPESGQIDIVLVIEINFGSIPVSLVIAKSSFSLFSTTL